MVKLIFKNEAMRKVIAHVRKGVADKTPFTQKAYTDEKAFTPALYIVKDQGLYLMPACNIDKAAFNKEDASYMSHVCYAQGYAPTGEDWWDKCHAVSADDFAEAFPCTEQLMQAIEKGADVLINITPKKLTVSYVQ